MLADSQANMTAYQASGLIGLSPTATAENVKPFLSQITGSLDNSQFSFYMSDTYTGSYNSLIFGGYDLKYAKEGSTDDDITWIDLILSDEARNGTYWTVNLGPKISYGDTDIPNTDERKQFVVLDTGTSLAIIPKKIHK